MEDQTSREQHEELRKFQKALTPERAYKLLSEAIEQRLTSRNKVPLDARIIAKLDLLLPW